jgi:quercetin dioxygenase-like cupin family protein
MAAVLCALGLACTLPAIAAAPPSGLKRTEVYRADASQPGHEAVVMKVEVVPGGHSGRHTHPGDEISYVLDGQGVLLVDGAPPRTVKAGDAFVVKAGTVHEARNDGSAPLHLIDVYYVEKGKPLATPAK